MGTRVIITDIDQSAADSIAGQLDASFCTPRTAYDRVDTLNQLQDGNFDVAVIDIDLPESGGLELLNEIRMTNLELRVIISSPREKPDEILRALIGDASNYLTKPYSVEELQKAVKHAMSEKEAVERLDVSLGQQGWIELMMPSSLNYMTRLDRFFRLFYKSEIPANDLEEISYCFKEIVSVCSGIYNYL